MERLETLKTVGVTGASGFIGQHLVRFLRENGYRVISFVRQQAFPIHQDERLYKTNAGEIDPSVFQGVDCLIHLAGKNLSDSRWNHEEKEALRNSRIVTTELISKALAKMSSPPKVFLCASAIGIYGDRKNERIDESSKRGSGFLAQLCDDWESATKSAVRAGIRVVQLRTGIVLAKDGGALSRMLPFFKRGLGSVTGSGEQYMSWISLHDYTRAVLHAMQDASLNGPVNLVSPSPVTNREFCKALAAALHRPLLLFMPSLLVNFVFGEMGNALLLQGARVYPTKLTNSGFVFHDNELYGTLHTMLGDEKHAKRGILGS